MTGLRSVTVSESQLVIVERDVYRGRGSSATLHRVRIGGETLLYKVYKPGFPVALAELETLVRWRLGLTSADRDYVDTHSAFPSRVVTNETGIAGICMREASDSFFFISPMQSNTKRPRSLDYLSNTPTHALTVGAGYFEPPHKLAVLGDLLGFILWLHSRDVVVGDLNAENVLISDSAGPDKFIMLDCDSLWIAGRSATPKHEPPPMACPWGPSDSFTLDTDLFKFALLSVRCLQEDNAEENPDHGYLAKIMPSDQGDCLLSLLEPGGSVSQPRIQALSRTWSKRMAPDGRLSGSNDSAMIFAWRPGMAPSPRSARPDAPAVVTSGGRRRLVAVAVAALLVLIALLVVLYLTVLR